LADRLQRAAPLDEVRVRAFEQACRELESAYLASELESTDAASSDAPWFVDDRRDTLGSATVDSKLRIWQAQDAEHPFVKFAVVRAPDASSLLVRTTRRALEAAGYLPPAATDLTVYDNPSGGYADARLVH